MRLARKLGMSLKRAKEEITLAELKLWIADYAMEPWGEERADIRHGILCSAIMGSRGIESRPSDFIPEFGEEEQNQPSVADQVNSMFVGFNLMGGELNGSSGEHSK